MSHEGTTVTVPMVRLSIPGNLCVHCGTEITRQLRCSGCGWVDPLTKSRPQKVDSQP